VAFLLPRNCQFLERVREPNLVGLERREITNAGRIAIAGQPTSIPARTFIGIGLDNQVSFRFFPYHCSAIRSSSIITPSSSSTLAVIAYVTCGGTTGS
jgi:hypothetical protein